MTDINGYLLLPPWDARYAEQTMLTCAHCPTILAADEGCMDLLTRNPRLTASCIPCARIVAPSGTVRPVPGRSHPPSCRCDLLKGLPIGSIPDCFFRDA